MQNPPNGHLQVRPLRCSCHARLTVTVHSHGRDVTVASRPRLRVAPPTALQVAPLVARPVGATSPMRFGAKSASPATTPLAGGAWRIFRTRFEDGTVRRRSPCRTRLFVCLVCRSCPRCRGSGVTDLKSLRIVLRHRDMSQRVVCRSRSRSCKPNRTGHLHEVHHARPQAPIWNLVTIKPRQLLPFPEGVAVVRAQG